MRVPKKIFIQAGMLFLTLTLAACEDVPDSQQPANGQVSLEENVLVRDARDTLEKAQPLLEKLVFAARVDEARELLGQAREVEAKLAALHSEADSEENSDSEMSGVVQGKVERGDTIAGILENAGNGKIRDYVNAAARILPLKSFRAGQRYTVITDPQSGRIRRFEYEMNDRHRLIVEGEKAPAARVEEIEYVTLLESCEGVIDDSLFQAVADMGESPVLALRLVELFGSEINFIRDLKDGDKFSVLIEKRFREGEYKGYGRILAATFTARGKTFEAYLYRDLQGRLQHYNGQGENLKKTLLMAPLAVTRLTSRFTHARQHPILGGTRPHLGVDYAAPMGTPVKAVGEGVVTKKGWNGGYGNQIIVQHEAGLESHYAHLSGFAQGLRPGQRVRQGQVIGFVGSTGLSTGPHLDFRLRHKGEFINPAKAINPRHAPVEPGLMSAFRKMRDQARSYLKGAPIPAQYTTDSLVPAQVALARPEKIRKAVRGKGTVRSSANLRASETGRRAGKNIKNARSAQKTARIGARKTRESRKRS